MLKKSLLIVVVSLMGLVLSVSAITPTTMSYQGLLLDSGGNPVLDDTYPILFTIYDAATVGNSKWSETQNVSTTDGAFTVSLGTVNPILDTVFDSHLRWLAIKIGIDPETTPRTRLHTNPYAFRVASINRATGGEISGSVDISDSLSVRFARITVDLDVDRDAVIDDDLSVGGSTAIAGGLDVGGPATMSSSITVGSSIAAGTDLIVSGSASVGGALGVSGHAMFADGMGVTDSLIVAGKVTVAGDVDCVNLDATGLVTVGSHLSAGGALYTGSTATIVSDASIGGDATISGGLAVGGAATIGSNATVSGTLNVSGSSTIGTNGTINGNLVVGGTADMGGNSTVGGTLDVSGATTLHNHASVAGNLDVGGTSQLGGDVTVTAGVDALDGITTGDMPTGTGMRFGKKFSAGTDINPIVECYSGYIWWDASERQLKLVETNAGNGYCHYILGKNEGAGMVWSSGFINAGGTRILATLNVNGECATVEVSSEAENGGYIKLYCMYSNVKLIAHYSYRYQ